MEGRRMRAVGSLLGATILLGSLGAGTALAQGTPEGPGDDPGTIAKTTQATVDRANDLKKQACDAATASAAAAAADPGNVDKQAKAAADAAKCATATASADAEAKSLAGVNGGIAAEPANATLPTDSHQAANGAVKSDNLTWLSNSRGLSNQVANPN